MPVAAKFQVVQSLVLSRSTNLSAQIQPFNLALRPLFFRGSPFEVFKGRTRLDLLYLRQLRAKIQQFPPV